MADKIFGDLTLQMLKRSLDAYALRQRVIAENIAQAETPGYRSRSVSFETILQKAIGDGDAMPLRRRQAGHLPQAESPLPPPVVLDSSDRALANGINDVNIDMEMAALAETSLNHKLATRILARRYEALRSAIRGQASP